MIEKHVMESISFRTGNGQIMTFFHRILTECDLPDRGHYIIRKVKGCRPIHRGVQITEDDLDDILWNIHQGCLCKHSHGFASFSTFDFFLPFIVAHGTMKIDKL